MPIVIDYSPIQQAVDWGAAAGAGQAQQQVFQNNLEQQKQQQAMQEMVAQQKAREIQMALAQREQQHREEIDATTTAREAARMQIAKDQQDEALRQRQQEINNSNALGMGHLDLAGRSLDQSGSQYDRTLGWQQQQWNEQAPTRAAALGQTQAQTDLSKAQVPLIQSEVDRNKADIPMREAQTKDYLAQAAQRDAEAGGNSPAALRYRMASALKAAEMADNSLKRYYVKPDKFTEDQTPVLSVPPGEEENFKRLQAFREESLRDYMAAKQQLAGGTPGVPAAPQASGGAPGTQVAPRAQEVRRNPQTGQILGKDPATGQLRPTNEQGYFVDAAPSPAPQPQPQQPPQYAPAPQAPPATQPSQASTPAGPGNAAALEAAMQEYNQARAATKEASKKVMENVTYDDKTDAVIVIPGKENYFAQHNQEQLSAIKREDAARQRILDLGGPDPKPKSAFQ